MAIEAALLATLSKNAEAKPHKTASPIYALTPCRRRPGRAVGSRGRFRRKTVATPGGSSRAPPSMSKAS